MEEGWGKRDTLEPRVVTLRCGCGCRCGVSVVVELTIPQFWSEPTTTGEERGYD